MFLKRKGGVSKPQGGVLRFSKGGVAFLFLESVSQKVCCKGGVSFVCCFFLQGGMLQFCRKGGCCSFARGCVAVGLWVVLKFPPEYSRQNILA